MKTGRRPFEHMKKISFILLVFCVIGCVSKHKGEVMEDFNSKHYEELKEYLKNSNKNHEKMLSEDFERGKRQANKREEKLMHTIEKIDYSSYKSLVSSANYIEDYVGTPSTKRDSLLIKFALQLIEIATENRELDKMTYRLKLDMLASLDEWEDALETVNHWLKLKSDYYYDYMLKGYVLSKIGNEDSLQYSFLLAKEKLKVELQRDSNDFLLLHDLIIELFLSGEEAGMKTINNIILNRSDSQYWQFIKENLVSNFNRNAFIDENVFIKSKVIVLSTE